MSLYAKYLAERTDDQILESASAFATYRYLNEKQVYIIDIYCEPHARKQGMAARLADGIAELALARGCTQMIGTVCTKTRGAEDSVKVLFAYGMRLLSANNDVIFFVKDLR